MVNFVLIVMYISTVCPSGLVYSYDRIQLTENRFYNHRGEGGVGKGENLRYS
jgi:hypothetical protein